MATMQSFFYVLAHRIYMTGNLIFQFFLKSGFIKFVVAICAFVCFCIKNIQAITQYTWSLAFRNIIPSDCLYCELIICNYCTDLP